MRKTPWQHLKANPPAFVFLMARRCTNGKNVRSLSLEEVAIGGGLTLDRTREISWQISWDGVSIPEAERYLAGCNFDPLNADDRNRKGAYVRASKKRNPASIYAYLKNSPLWTKEYLPRINLLRFPKKSSAA
jgi:hypothetical protein